jgi:hypothetical protein
VAARIDAVIDASPPPHRFDSAILEQARGGDFSRVPGRKKRLKALLLEEETTAGVARPQVTGPQAVSVDCWSSLPL